MKSEEMTVFALLVLTVDKKEITAKVLRKGKKN